MDSDAKATAHAAQLASPSYRLAALDQDFLLGPSMRGVRFLLEFAKVDEALRDWGVRSTIVVFGSARVRERGPGRQAAWYAAAREFGAIALRSDYDPAGYTFRLGLFDEGKLHLLMRGAIAVDCPVRLLHGMSDASVPWQTSLSLVGRLTSRDVQVTLIKDGDHRLSRNGDLERLGRTLDELFETVC